MNKKILLCSTSLIAFLIQDDGECSSSNSLSFSATASASKSNAGTGQSSDGRAPIDIIRAQTKEKETYAKATKATENTGKGNHDAILPSLNEQLAVQPNAPARASSASKSNFKP
ncbi:hypothetical protein FACS189472_13880 [Alphaproteobacteria bacterium]|nr:hypothetical protein FACS189472_13880 [Alphaproteobacteria bacterium]